MISFAKKVMGKKRKATHAPEQAMTPHEAENSPVDMS